MQVRSTCAVETISLHLSVLNYSSSRQANMRQAQELPVLGYDLQMCNENGIHRYLRLSYCRYRKPFNILCCLSFHETPDQLELEPLKYALTMLHTLDYRYCTI